MDPYTILINPEACTGCRTCEVVCSLFHAGECNPRRSRVSVAKWESNAVFIPVMCQHCEVPMCQEVCSTNAIFRNETTGAIQVDQDKCIGCRMCIFACPFGGPAVDPVNRKIIKCDLCDGQPQCAKFCVTGAISYIRTYAIGNLKRRAGVKKLAELQKSLNPVSAQDEEAKPGSQ